MPDQPIVQAVPQGAGCTGTRVVWRAQQGPPEPPGQPPDPYDPEQPAPVQEPPRPIPIPPDPPPEPLRSAR